jgi:hypothetical protein
MAKVSKTTWYVDGAPVVCEIHVDSSGEFSVKLPEPVASTLQKSRVSGQTLNAARRAWELALAEYANAKTTACKVILYHVGMSMDRLGRSDLQGKFDTVSFSDGIALDLAVGVYEEKKRSLSTGFNYSYTLLESSIPIELSLCNVGHRRGDRREEWLLEWTPEREAWFAEFGKGYLALIDRLIGMFSSTKTLEAGIAAGRRLTSGKEE